MSTPPTTQEMLDHAVFERERLRGERDAMRDELVLLAQLVDRGERGAGSMAREIRRAHDKTYTDQDPTF